MALLTERTATAVLKALPVKHRRVLFPLYAKWDAATHAPVADGAALRLVTAADRAPGMLCAVLDVASALVPTFWDALSTATDDGATVWQPADVTGAGRWVAVSGGGGSGASSFLSVQARGGPSRPPRRTARTCASRSPMPPAPR